MPETTNVTSATEENLNQDCGCGCGCGEGCYTVKHNFQKIAS